MILLLTDFDSDLKNEFTGTVDRVMLGLVSLKNSRISFLGWFDQLQGDECVVCSQRVFLELGIQNLVMVIPSEPLSYSHLAKFITSVEYVFNQGSLPYFYPTL